jgi:hypothetical protein
VESLVFAGAIGMFLALLGGSAVLAIRESMGDRRVAQRRLQDWATGRGLTGTRGRVSGTVDGCPVEIRMLIGARNQGFEGSTSIKVAVTDTIPGGLRITPEPEAVLLAPTRDILVGDRLIDDRCEIHARDPDLARVVLGNTAVRAALRPLLESRARLWLSRFQLEARFEGRYRSDLDQRLSQLLTLAKTLEDAPFQPFVELAGRRGWAAPERPALRADGEIDGLQVRVRYRFDAEPPHTEVRVEVPNLEVLGLRVTLPEFADGPGLSTGDPIVDRLLHVNGRPADAVIRLLRDDELRARMLEVVHGHPGSAVRRGAVLLTVPGYDLSLIDRRIDLAVSLATALRAGCPDAVGEGE